MSLISTIIPSQAFEIVLFRIGEILKEELAAQSALDGNNQDINADVFVERFVPFDKTELPAVNVMLTRGALDGHSAIQTDGTYSYNVDCYVSSHSADGQRGDVLAMTKLHRLLGLCRAILEDPIYKTLGFAPPFIMNRRVTEIQVSEPEGKDARSSAMGRLTFTVKVPENCKLIVPNIIQGYETQVKLALSDKGYFYEAITVTDGFDYQLDANIA